MSKLLPERELLGLTLETLLGWAREEVELNDGVEEDLEWRYAEIVDSYLENLEAKLQGK